MRPRTNFVLPLIVGPLFSAIPAGVLAWGAEKTHHELAAISIERFNERGDFSRFLYDELALRSGLDESLSLIPWL